ncbi:hypothetical protein [Haladaptatus sp. NG-WS-4]
MPTSLHRGGETTMQDIEANRYGPPQHSNRTTAPEQTLYGRPQHETDVEVNVDIREPPSFELAWTNARYEQRRERPRLGSRTNAHQPYP